MAVPEQGTAYVLGIPCHEAVCVQAKTGYLLSHAREIDAILLKEEDWHRHTNREANQGTPNVRLGAFASRA